MRRDDEGMVAVHAGCRRGEYENMERNFGGLSLLKMVYLGGIYTNMSIEHKSYDLNKWE